MHRVEFRATRQCRNCLAGIQNLQWIEALAQCMELVAFRFAELHAHFTQLLYTNPMLSGNRASMMNTKLQDLAAELLGFFEFTLIIGIVEG